MSSRARCPLHALSSRSSISGKNQPIKQCNTCTLQPMACYAYVESKYCDTPIWCGRFAGMAYVRRCKNGGRRGCAEERCVVVQGALPAPGWFCEEHQKKRAAIAARRRLDKMERDRELRAWEKKMEEKQRVGVNGKRKRLNEGRQHISSSIYGPRVLNPQSLTVVG
jgi:hypothetical protein